MRRDFHTSLRLRLALIFAGGSLVTLLAISGFHYWAFQREINLRDQHLLEGRMREVSTLLQTRPEDRVALQEELQGEGLEPMDPQVLLRVLRDGQLVAETTGMARRLPVTWFQGAPKTKRKRRRYLMRSVEHGSFRIQGALNITEDERTIFSFRRRLLLTLLGGAAASAGFAAWAAHHGLRPLRAIAEATRGITAHRLRERLEPGQVPQELRDLVEALNDMLDRLDHAFTRLTQCSADLAHELRTPITVLMGEAEVALSRERGPEEYRQVLESSLDEFRRLSRLIGRMLFLARAEDPQTVLVRIPVDAARLGADLLAFFEAQAEEQGVALEADLAGMIVGDAELLRQALANLVSNALVATPAGGRVRLALSREEHRALLSVEDTGRGIPAAERPRLLDRFYRTQEALDRRTRGTGLGLAIVQSIARLHGGDVAIQSRPGVGTTVTLRLPR